MIEQENSIEIGEVLDRRVVIDLVDKWRYDLGFFAEEINADKPWGAYWKIRESQVEQFMYYFFPKMLEKPAVYGEKLSPKLLLVEPGQQLSWQYHDRRAENWKVVAGDVGIKMSMSDIEPAKMEIYRTGGEVKIGQSVRHRLVGLKEWGLVAEIWTHTDR